MKTFKTNNESLKKAIISLKTANSTLAAAKKIADREKEVIAAWLLTERKTNVETLPIGSNIVIQDDNGGDLLTFNVTGVETFNRTALSLAHPGLIEKFTEQTARRTFKPV